MVTCEQASWQGHFLMHTPEHENMSRTGWAKGQWRSTMKPSRCCQIPRTADLGRDEVINPFQVFRHRNLSASVFVNQSKTTSAGIPEAPRLIKVRSRHLLAKTWDFILETEAR